MQDKLVFVCSMDCSQEFKKANYVTCLCEYCKIEKITRDAKRINNKDCFFCSDGKETSRCRDLFVVCVAVCEMCDTCSVAS